MNFEETLKIYWHNTYELAQTQATTFTNAGDFKNAAEVARTAYAKAYGALEMMNYMLCNNGYSDIASKLVDSWQNAWEENFAILIKWVREHPEGGACS